MEMGEVKDKWSPRPEKTLLQDWALKFRRSGWCLRQTCWFFRTQSSQRVHSCSPACSPVRTQHKQHTVGLESAEGWGHFQSKSHSLPTKQHARSTAIFLIHATQSREGPASWFMGVFKAVGFLLPKYCTICWFCFFFFSLKLTFLIAK